MLILAIDLETTGLRPDHDQILEIGAIVFESENNTPLEKLSKFHVIVRHEYLIAEPYALKMNKDLVEKSLYPDSDLITDDDNIIDVNDVAEEFREWLFAILRYDKRFMKQKKITIAGKNVEAFDLPFLKNLPYSWAFTDLFHRRTLDPTSHFTDWENDTVLPNLTTCLERAGIDKEVSHTALEDAKDIIRLIRAMRNQ